MNIEAVVAGIKDSGTKVYACITGGGLGSLDLLTHNGGASKVLIGAEIPYSPETFDKFLGKKQEQYCSENAARRLAMESYLRGTSLFPNTNSVIGLGVTCSLAKNEPEREGRKHHIHLAVQTKLATKVMSCEFPGLPRSIEEKMTSEIILRFIGNKFIKEDCLLEFRKFITFEKNRISTCLEESLLFGDKVNYESYNLPGDKFILFPGSYNPKHVGHEEIAELASKQLGLPVVYEMSVLNADKGKIDYIEIGNRFESFTKENHILVTNAPKFIDKARLFPGHPMLLGVDTWIRVKNPKYYDNSISKLKEVLEEFKKLKTTFLVAPRMTDGVLEVLIEDEFSKDLCTPLAEMPKNLTISSSQIRKEQMKG